MSAEVGGIEPPTAFPSFSSASSSSMPAGSRLKKRGRAYALIKKVHAENAEDGLRPGCDSGGSAFRATPNYVLSEATPA